MSAPERDNQAGSPASRRGWISDLGIAAKAICSGFVVALLGFALSFAGCRVLLPECGPGSHDGQCGLSTFMSLIGAFGVRFPLDFRDDVFFDSA